MTGRPRTRTYSDEVRIGAMADYLLDHKVDAITAKWGVSHGMLQYWARRVRHTFKHRRFVRTRYAPPADRAHPLPLE